MPIYEYRCEHCGDFEESQRITDPPLQRCPKCRRKVRRLISNTTFQLKGSGWYATDFKNSGSKPAAKSSVEAGDKGAAKSDGKESGSGTADKTESSPAKSGGNTESKPAAAA